MDKNIPVDPMHSLDKYVKFVENYSHLDYESKDPLYIKAINKMNLSEEFFATLGHKMGIQDLSKEVEPFCVDFDIIETEYNNKMDEFGMQLLQTSSKKQEDFLRTKINFQTYEFYKKIGNLMLEYDIFKVLISKSNAAFRRVGAGFLYCDMEMVKDELERAKLDTMPVLAAKIAFNINKIVKTLDNLEYGELLKDDSSKSKINNDGRLKFISKLKTDYLNRVINICLVTYGDDKILNIVESRKDEYNRLFGEYFEDLDFEADLLKIHGYELRKNYFYESKAAMIDHIITTLSTYEKHKNKEVKRTKGISDWGLCRDENNQILLGVSLTNYPMPITIHLPQSIFNTIHTKLKRMCGLELAYNKLVVPRYKSLKGGEGIFSTNVLFQPTIAQKKKLEKEYQKNPNNPYLKFFYSNLFPQNNKNEERVYIELEEFC